MKKDSETKEQLCKRCKIGYVGITVLNTEGLCFPCETELRKAKFDTTPPEIKSNKEIVEKIFDESIKPELVRELSQDSETKCKCECHTDLTRKFMHGPSARCCDKMNGARESVTTYTEGSSPSTPPETSSWEVQLDLLLRNRIKFIGENEQSYTGTPVELKKEISLLIESVASSEYKRGWDAGEKRILDTIKWLQDNPPNK